MTLTLLDFCGLVIMIAAIILVTAAVVLVFDLRLTLARFRQTLSKVDDAFDEMRSTFALSRDLLVVVKARAESLSSTIQNFEESAGKLAAVIHQLTTYVLKPILIVNSLLGSLKAGLAALRRRRKKGGTDDVGKQGIHRD